MKKTTKKRIIQAACVVGVVAVVGLGYWKRVGIKNMVLRMAGVDMSKSYGYYQQEVPVNTKNMENVKIQENEETEAFSDSNIPMERTLVSETKSIEEQVQAEVDSGNYSFEEPLILNNPYKNAPLTGLIIFQTEESCGVRVTVKGKEEAQDITGELDADTVHRVPVVGLYPSYENTVVLELLDDQGQVTKTREIKMQTTGLPEYMKDAIKMEQASGESAYGLTIVFGQNTKYPFGYDDAGDIRWYMEVETADTGLYLMADGRMILQEKSVYIPSQRRPHTTNLYEIDYLGRAYNLYYVPNGTHHEVIEKEPGGNLLVLSNSLEDHIEEVIVELDRSTGEVVASLNLEDIFGKTYVDRPDWAHINTVSYQPEDDTILISPRNLHSGMKINWTTHELEWILGDPAFWKDTDFEEYVLTPQGDFDWHYQQHSVYEVETDLDQDPDTIQIIMYDNHVDNIRKAESYDDLEGSYVKIYAVNEKEKTVNLLKEYKMARSRITSNAAYDAETGHVFGMCGYVEEEGKERGGKAYEFDYETGEVIREYVMKNHYYRAEHMVINYSDLASPAVIADHYIKGELRSAVETGKKVKDPEQMLEGGVSLKTIGSVVYVNANDHHVSQVIFRGKEHNYVYDTTDIKLKKKLFLKIVGDLPIPTGNMEPDTYEIFCVYMNEYYDTGMQFTKNPNN